MQDTFAWKCFLVEDFFKKYNKPGTSKVNYINSLFIVSDKIINDENELLLLLNPGETLERDQYFFIDKKKLMILIMM